jgi:uncharacterized protein (DUF697 family)/tellurite resistance protein
VETRKQPNNAEAEALLTVCLLAAFADGAKSEVERAAIRRMADTLPNLGTDRAALYQKVLLGQVSSAQAVQPLERQELRRLAYEMAVCVCAADNLLTPLEKNFLEQLRQVLRLDVQMTTRIEKETEAVAFPDFVDAESATTGVSAKAPAPTRAADAKSDSVDSMILNYSILNGALELMPQSLATLAIIPLQMKMVYRIGKNYGYELDRGHIKELLAAAGVGLSSQVLEGYATKLFGGLFGKLAGGIGKTVANQATNSALSFAATYAIGHMAQLYYAGGRTLSNVEMRSLFDQLKQKASGLHANYAGQIQQKSKTIDTTQLLNLIKNQ